ncbi:MAG: rod shape-determining protein MreD [Bacteroidales bacterium]|nr:rod shape-determining protein MreD [Bacteroidales bacterium]
MRELVQYIFLFVALLLLQVFVLNNIHIAGWATPFLYILFFLKLPTEMSRNWSITLGFIFGLIIDLFSNTPGLFALSTAFLAFLRNPLIYLYVPKDDVKNGAPSYQTIGIGAFLKFAITASLIFCFTIFFVESFSLFNLKLLLLKIVTSTILTFILIISIESIKPINK